MSKSEFIWEREKMILTIVRNGYATIIHHYFIIEKIDDE